MKLFVAILSLTVAISVLEGSHIVVHLNGTLVADLEDESYSVISYVFHWPPAWIAAIGGRSG